MVKVEITAAAKKDLQQIYRYLTMKTFSFENNRKLRNSIRKARDLLRTFPKSGMRELMLEDIGEFRYIVVQKHYKLIYTLRDDICYVVAVWDCRNNPSLLKGRFENRQNE